jgi:hypothetical protein
VIHPLDRAFLRRDEVRDRTRRVERLARLDQLDLLDSIRREDGDFATLQPEFHGVLP